MNIQPRDNGNGHFYVSICKSVIRIGAGGFIITGRYVMAGILVILAEMLGIVEELV